MQNFVSSSTQLKTNLILNLTTAWVTCDEVDPHTGHTSQVNAVDEGGNYESLAFDDRDPSLPAGQYRFYTTEDSSNGA